MWLGPAQIRCRKHWCRNGTRRGDSSDLRGGLWWIKWISLILINYYMMKERMMKLPIPLWRCHWHGIGKFPFSTQNRPVCRFDCIGANNECPFNKSILLIKLIFFACKWSRLLRLCVQMASVPNLVVPWHSSTDQQLPAATHNKLGPIWTESYLTLWNGYIFFFYVLIFI